MKNFNYMWIASIVNNVGNKLSIFSFPLIAIYIFNTDILKTTMITAISFLPNLLFSLHIGVFVDRFNKRKIIIISNIISCILTFLLFILSIYKIINLTVFYIGIFLLNTSLIFSSVAFYSQIPLILKKEDIKNANYKLEISSNIIDVISPTISSIILTIISAPIIFLIDSLSFFISAIFQSFVKYDTKFKNNNSSSISYFQQIKKGITFIIKNEILKKIATSYFIIVFSIGIFQSIQTFYLKNTLNFDLKQIGLIFTIANIGLILSSLSSLKISNKLGAGNSIIKALSLYSLGFSCYLINNIYVICLGTFILNFALPLYNVNMLTLRQKIIPSNILATTSVIWRVLGRGLIPIGSVLSGILSTKFTIQTTIILCIVIAGLGVIPVLTSKKLKKYSD